MNWQARGTIEGRLTAYLEGNWLGDGGRNGKPLIFDVVGDVECNIGNDWWRRDAAAMRHCN